MTQHILYQRHNDSPGMIVGKSAARRHIRLIASAVSDSRHLQWKTFIGLAKRYHPSPIMSTTMSNGHTNGEVNGHKQVNAWQQPGPAAYDFRSDVFTTPTPTMLEAISQTTLLDDVFMEDPTTNSLHTFIADLTGHEASLLVMSGTMGNQVALRSHLTHPPHSVLCDKRGHIFNYEAGGTSTWSQAMLIPILPSNKRYLTLEDVETNVIISDDVHACPTRVISLENTLNGMVMPLTELQKISAFAREHNIIIHMDGARLWEAVASGAGTLKDYCALVDSTSLCFSKGLGAPIGSVITGSQAFITQARRIRKMFGGGTRQAGVISAPARVAVEETFLGGKLKASHERALRIAQTWEKKGGKLANPTETNMVWIDLKAADVSVEQFQRWSKEEGITVSGGRLVVHYQITDESETKLERVMDKMLSKHHTHTNGQT